MGVSSSASQRCVCHDDWLGTNVGRGPARRRATLHYALRNLVGTKVSRTSQYLAWLIAGRKMLGPSINQRLRGYLILPRRILGAAIELFVEYYVQILTRGGIQTWTV